MPFIILNPETRVEYELNDVAFFLSEYAPQGFVIAPNQPTGYAAPALPDDATVIEDADGNREIDLSKMTRAESVGIAGAADLPNKDAVIAAIDALSEADGNA